MVKVLVDNDILLKLSCFGLQGELEAFLNNRGATLEMLAVAAFVLPRYLERLHSVSDKESATANLRNLMALCGQIEPNAEELSVAVDLEEQAQLLGLQFDTGESQLISLLISRKAALMITGDKRAIGAITRLGVAGSVQGRVGCLEQLVLCFVVVEGGFHVRTSVCREQRVDKSLAICFSCSNPIAVEETISEGLHSYIEAIRQAAPNVLADNTLGLGPVT